MNQEVVSIRKAPVSAADGVASFWGAQLWYEFCSLCSCHLMTLGFSLRMEGGCHVPKKGPALVVANHQSFLDPMPIGQAFPRRLIYLARKSLFRNPVFGWLIRSLNAVPIDQEGVGKEGIRTILDALGRGKAVLVFPEGERTWTGSMNTLKPGVHLLIKRTQAPIIPVGIAGAYDAWPRWRAFPIPSPVFWPPNKGTIAVSIGKPLDRERFAALPRDQALALLFDEIAKVQRRAEELRRQ